MIRPLRSRHRRIVTALAVLTPLLFVAGLAVRRPIPTMAGLQIEPATERYAGHVVLALDEGAWPGLPIRTEWLQGQNEAARPAVRLQLTGPLKQPDLLLYWDAAPVDGRLSDSAYLLGPVGDRHQGTWDVPATTPSGRLVLYSLAHQELVATAAPPDGWVAIP